MSLAGFSASNHPQQTGKRENGDTLFEVEGRRDVTDADVRNAYADGYEWALLNYHDEACQNDLARLRAALADPGATDLTSARAWDEGFAARAQYNERRDVPLDWPDLNPYRAALAALADER